MRRTFFPSALFGLCSTCLLLLGLSSLRSDPRLFAQSQHPNRHSPDLNESFGELWFAPDDSEGADRSDSPNLEEDLAFSQLEIDPEAWDTGPVAGDPSVNDPKAGYLTSGESSGYRYYYRFVAEDSWSVDSASVDEEAGDPWLWLSDLPQDAEDSAGPAEYGFIDEYSSEEAARYEMAQEGCWQDHETTLAETEADLPWDTESYELLEPQDNVAGRGGRCLILNRRIVVAAKSVGETMITVAELEAEMEAERARAYHQPDYEADVAAGWLFAANRNTDLESFAFNTSSTDEIDAFGLFEEQTDDEAYEAWEVLEDQGFDQLGPEEMNEWDEVDDSLGPAVPETSSPELLPRDDSAATSPGNAEDRFESWIIVNHEPIVGTSSDDGESSAPIFDTPWHGEPGENFAWPELSEHETLSAPETADSQLEQQDDAVDRGNDDPFPWMDPADDRYYDSSFGEETEEGMFGEDAESHEPISNRDMPWDKGDALSGDLGEEWDLGQRGYHPSEMAPPIGDPNDEGVSTEDVTAEEVTDFGGESDDSVSLKRMGAAVMGLVSPFRFWH